MSREIGTGRKSRSETEGDKGGAGGAPTWTCTGTSHDRWIIAGRRGINMYAVEQQRYSGLRNARTRACTARSRPPSLPSRSPPACNPCFSVFSCPKWIPRPPGNRVFPLAHACLRLVSHFCRFAISQLSSGSSNRWQTRKTEKGRKGMAFVFLRAAFYRPELCAESLLIPLFLSTLFHSFWSLFFLSFFPRPFFLISTTMCTASGD